MNLILDYETLDVTPTACVASVAFILFDPSEFLSVQDLEKKSLSIKFDWMEQINMGRTTSDSTIEFWKQPENKEAFDLCVAPSDADVSIKDFPKILDQYLTENNFYDNIGFVFSRGNAFDLSIHDNIFEMLGAEKLFPFWTYRDVRTEVDAIMQHLDLEHDNSGYVRNFEVQDCVKHNSVHDCARDIHHMQYAHYQLAVKLGE